MFTYIHIDIYVHIPTDAYLLPAHKGDVYINPLDMLDICIYTYVHVSTNKVQIDIFKGDVLMQTQSNKAQTYRV